jgi:citrate lyase subunit beta-like protein
MLEKSITTGSDVIIYDLEDSVSPAPLDKANARGRLTKFLAVRATSIVTFKLEDSIGSEILYQDKQQRLRSINVAVRVNAITTPYFHDDISQIVKD